MCSLFQYTSSATLKSKATKIRDHFLATALKFIFDLQADLLEDKQKKEKSLTENQIAIVRALSLLIQYLRQFEEFVIMDNSGDQSKKTNNTSSSSADMKIFVKPPHGFGNFFMVNPNEQLKSIKCRIAEWMNVLPRQIRCLIQDREVPDESKTATELKLDTETLTVRIKGLNVILHTKDNHAAPPPGTILESQRVVEEETIYDQDPKEALAIEGLSNLFSALGLQNMLLAKKEV